MFDKETAMSNLRTIMAYLIIALIYAGLIWAWTRVVRGVLKRRASRDNMRKQAAELRAKLIAAGKINAPTGKYKPRRWARKWVDYANSIPAPSAQSKHVPRVKELPKHPMIGKE